MSEVRASRERLERHGIRPNRELGQNFLVDDNILDLIGRMARLDPGDSVLEIGGGLGVLSAYLAPRVAHLHVVESDRRLEPVLAEALAGERAEVHIADVMELDLAALDPRPGKVVANLPYGVAVPALLRTIAELPSVGLWCVMVQREIADRLAAGPGTKAYGIPSVLVQLSCKVGPVRPISRTVFRPAPHVDSALVVLRRTGPAAAPPVRALVHAAFAHRRKALAGSLALAGSPASGESPAPRGSLALAADGVTESGGRSDGGHAVRDRARSALVAMGHPADERAERLAPQEFVELAERLEAP